MPNIQEQEGKGEGRGPLVFEVSWEVGNKVGGIHTVLATKAAHMVERYGENYCCVGPYFPDKVKGEFKEQTPPEKLKDIFGRIEKKCGIRCHFGTWLIHGEPRVVLIDFRAAWQKVNEIKGELWQWYQIDSLGTGFDFDEPLVFSYASACFLEEISARFAGAPLIAHFHEWLAGGALLYLKKRAISIATIFTTHATVLGRALAYHEGDFYGHLSEIHPDERAREFHIHAKHSVEKNAAQAADVCTTVSEITALEVEAFLGRKPDVLLLNGLDTKKFLTFEEITLQHRTLRRRMREFLLFYFFPYYTFDIEETLFYFLASRYEFRAKGIDIFITALSLLNQKLIAGKSKKTIVVFFFTPTKTVGINAELLENRDFFNDIQDFSEGEFDDMKERLLYSFVAGHEITEAKLFNKDFLFEMKKKQLRLKKEGTPLLTAFELSDPHDATLEACARAGLMNRKEDKVKVVLYPVYLSGHDGLLNLNYHESIQASHLGVFPSLYEPWGYTPLETAASGVSAITTDLTGYGRFCETLTKNKAYPGIFVLKRLEKSDTEAAESLADMLYRFSRFSRRERVENKIQARTLAALASWDVLIKNYFDAHRLALSRQKART